ncbi:MAG TPA: protein kinase [Polyangiaceae bacterium]|nr:protein kinase [Polyangiaceae bacterium]
MTHDEYLPGQFLPGTVYRIVRLIGRGGSGRVYEVEDSTAEKRYALKTIADPDADVRELSNRLMRESQILAKISDPRVVGVYTGGVLTDGRCFYVMELLGEPLRTSLRQKGKLDLGFVLPVGIQLGEALASMHAVGIVHRDVKPDNVFVASGAPGPASAKLLLDLGVASAAEGKGPSTVSGYGTFGYASPEQLRGEPASPCMDIWSLGCVLFQALSGRLPFEVSSDWRTYVDGVLGSTPAPRLSEACPDVPAELVALLARMLRKDSSRRLPRAEMVSATLRRIGLRRSSPPPAGPVDLDPAVETLLKATSPPPASPAQARTEGTPTRPLRVADVVEAPTEGTPTRPLHVADVMEAADGTPTRPLHIADVIAATTDATPTRPLHIADIMQAQTEGTPTRPLHVADLTESSTDRDLTVPRNFFNTKAGRVELGPAAQAPAEPAAVEAPPEAAAPIATPSRPVDVDPPDETLVGATLTMAPNVSPDGDALTARDETAPTLPIAPAQPAQPPAQPPTAPAAPLEQAASMAIPSLAHIDPPEETLVGTMFPPDAADAPAPPEETPPEETPTLHLADAVDAPAPQPRTLLATTVDAVEAQTDPDETAPTLPTTPARAPAEAPIPAQRVRTDLINTALPRQIPSQRVQTGVVHTAGTAKLASQHVQTGPVRTAVPRQIPSQRVQTGTVNAAVPASAPVPVSGAVPVNASVPVSTANSRQMPPPQPTQTGRAHLDRPGVARLVAPPQARPANMASAVADSRPSRTQWVQVPPAETRGEGLATGARREAFALKNALALSPPPAPISEPRVPEPAAVRAPRLTYALLFLSVLLAWMTVGLVFFRFAGSRKRSRLQ